MKNITLSADERLIDAAREKARNEHTTLNEQFRRWLADYTRNDQHLDQYDVLMKEIRGKVRVGRKLGRNEMNER